MRRTIEVLVFLISLMVGSLFGTPVTGESSKSEFNRHHPVIIPQPAVYQVDTAQVYGVKERSVLVNYLERVGFALGQSPGSTPVMDLTATLLTTPDTLLGEEGYHLVINQKGIKITANTPEGLFYGHQTLRQLVMQLDDRSSDVLRLTHLTIIDYPAFAWRGMLLDCCRHFMEKDFILRYIDLLSFYKMNIFHWHLTEDQGWRIEIEKYPLLTEIGAWRTGADGTRYGGYYTKDDIREVVDYAASRNIQVVPEIEMPGHAMAALAAYPALSCTGGPFEVPSTWGVFKDIYCAGNDSVFVFLQDVLDEVLELFPSEYIHIGGDEAPKYRWENCDKCRSCMAQHGLKEGYALQSWFIGRMAEFLRSRGRTLVGWDEIREGGLPKGVIVQSWQGFDGAIDAATAGNRAIVSPTSHAYFDYPVHKLPLEQVYAFNPIPEDLDPSLYHYIIGGACNMWTERAPQEVVDQRVFPRLLAMTEVLWSAPVERNFEKFRQRARQHYPILAAKGVNYGLEAGGVTIETTHNEDQIIVTLIPEQDNIIIRYSTDHKSNQLDKIYATPLIVKDSMTLHTAAYIDDQRVSDLYSRNFYLHRGVGLPYSLTREPGGTYNLNPETTLTDGVRGTLDFHDGLWLGFWEKDVNIHFQVPRGEAISSVQLGFMQSNPSWIFVPEYVKLTIKPRGLFKRKIIIKNNLETHQDVLYALEDLLFKIPKSVEVRSMNIKVKNPGRCPSWHPAAGSPTWVFIDEITIQ